jgi:hypothetical protein
MSNSIDQTTNINKSTSTNSAAEMPKDGLDVNKIVGEAEEAKNRQIWVQAQMNRISSEASTAEVIFKTINKINDRIANARV